VNPQSSKWLDRHPLLPVLTFFVVVFALGGAIGLVPVGPSTILSGRIQRIETYDDKSGRHHRLIVAVPEGLARVGVSDVAYCGPGDEVTLRRVQHLLGRAYLLEVAPCMTVGPGPFLRP
jgi:hypothetical protein